MIVKRYAIVIGSNNYESNRLNCTLKDAEDMKNILIKKCRFEAEDIELFTFELHNKESISKIDEAFEKIKKVFIKGQDNFLFYFSGHGIAGKEENTVLQISDNEEYDVREIYKKIANLKPKNDYLIIDSCYSGGKIKSKINNKNKLDKVFETYSKGSYCLFASTISQRARENGFSNGLLTHFILEVLNKKDKYTDNVMTIKGVDDYVSIKVPKEDMLLHGLPKNFNSLQTPVSNYDIKGIVDYFAFWDEKEEEIKPKEKPKLAFQIDSSDYELIDLVVEAEINWNLFFSLISNFDEEKNNLHQNYFEPIGKILDKHIKALLKRSDDEILSFIDTLHTNLSLYKDWTGGDWKTWDIYVNVVNEIFNHWKNNEDIQVVGFCFLWHLTAIKESYNAKKVIVSILKSKTYDEETKHFYKSIAQYIEKRKIIFRGNLYDEIINEINIPKQIRDATKKIKEEEPSYDPFLTNDKIGTNLPF
ncbi:MAG: caspase family protein [Cytophagales bacterium]|nr:MAG: caspase family protein [Cytophagales bacterium]